MPLRWNLPERRALAIGDKRLLVEQPGFKFKLSVGYRQAGWKRSTTAFYKDKEYFTVFLSISSCFYEKGGAMLSSAVSTITHLHPKNKGTSSSQHLAISNFSWLGKFHCQWGKKTDSPDSRPRDRHAQVPIKWEKTGCAQEATRGCSWWNLMGLITRIEHSDQPHCYP